MKKTFFLLLVFNVLSCIELLAQCDCSSVTFFYSDSVKNYRFEKRFVGAWKEDSTRRIIHTVLLQPNTDYLFEIRDKKGLLKPNLKVNFLNPKREIIASNVDMNGNIKTYINIKVVVECIMYIEMCLIKPTSTYCNCRYLFMSIRE